jgi:precorrin-2 dehydrogenase/sirohydrochlorin ferrochelatase
MVPIALDPKFCKLAVVGNGDLALRRLSVLRAGGAVPLVFADAPATALVAQAGDDLRLRLPDADDLAALNVLWVVDVAEGVGEGLAAAARALKVLVNFEDRPAFCDFHSVAEVRRGDLVLTVSTNGAAPGLAGTIRRGLETCFGPEWDGRVAEVARLRAGWRAEGMKMPEAARRIEEIVAAGCWLNCPKPGSSKPDATPVSPS